MRREERKKKEKKKKKQKNNKPHTCTNFFKPQQAGAWKAASWCVSRDANTVKMPGILSSDRLPQPDHFPSAPHSILYSSVQLIIRSLTGHYGDF